MRLLNQDREARPRSAVEVADELRRVIEPDPDVAVVGLTLLGVNARGCKEYRNEKDGTVLGYIRPAEFTMGSSEFEEAPPHQVALDDYLIAKSPVTNVQYRRFCQATGHPEPRQMNEGEGHSHYFWDPRYDHHPVLGVTWDDAKAYCDRADLELPTEAQWEHAARGRDQRKYPWGDEEPAEDRANYKTGGPTKYTQPVDSHPKGESPFGILDMAGNVWEWCADWYDVAAYARCDDGERNPRGPTDPHTYRVVRGGSWNFQSGYLRAAQRNWGLPTQRYQHVGFRATRSRLR